MSLVVEPENLIDAICGDNLEFLLMFHTQMLNLKLNGQTLLHYACSKGSFSCLEYLLDNNVYLDAQESKHGFTPIIRAYYQGYFEIVKRLGLTGANIDLYDHGGRQLYHHCLRHLDLPMIQWLQIYRGLSLESLDAQGHSPIFHVLSMDLYNYRSRKKERYQLVNYLLVNKVPVNWMADEAPDIQGKLIHSLCVYNKMAPILKMLVAQTQDKIKKQQKKRRSSFNLKQLTQSWRTNSMFEKDHSTRSLKFDQLPEDNLNFQPINWNLVSDRDQMTPLMWAIYGDAVDNVRILLDCPEVDPNFVTELGSTALSFCLGQGNTYILKILLQHSRVSLTIPNQESVLRWILNKCPKNSHQTSIRIMLEMGLSLEKERSFFVNCDGLMIRACQRGIPELVEVGLRLEPDLANHACECCEVTPWYTLMLNGHKKSDYQFIADLLLEVGTDLRREENNYFEIHRTDDEEISMFQKVKNGPVVEKMLNRQPDLLVLTPLTRYYNYRIWKPLALGKNLARNTIEIGTLDELSEVDKDEFILMHNGVAWDIENLGQYIINIVRGINQYDTKSDFAGEPIWNQDDLEAIYSHPFTLGNGTRLGNVLRDYLDISKQIKGLRSETIEIIGETGSILWARGDIFDKKLHEILSPDEYEEWQEVKGDRTNEEMPQGFRSTWDEIAKNQKNTFSGKIEQLKYDQFHKFYQHFKSLNEDELICLENLHEDFSNQVVEEVQEGSFCIMIFGAFCTKVYGRVQQFLKAQSFQDWSQARAVNDDILDEDESEDGEHESEEDVESESAESEGSESEGVESEGSESEEGRQESVESDDLLLAEIENSSRLFTEYLLDE